MTLSFISLKIVFDFSAFKRLGLIRYIVLKLNHSNLVAVAILKKTSFHNFKAISTQKDVKYTFPQNIFLGIGKVTAIVLCVYDRESTSMCYISFVGSLYASFKLVITTGYCVLIGNVCLTHS